MQYSELLRGIEYTGTAPRGEAALVTQDSRKVQPGAVFVCVAGRTSDGHDFAARAVQVGAGLVVSARPLGLPNEIVVKDTRAAYAALSANFFDNPAAKLTLVAVTGTNGKTTVTSVLKQVLAAQGVECGLIGTIRSEIGPVEIPAKFTTPEAWDLNALLARMVAAGCTHAVMEASSQALEQGRLLGVRFALGVFTNLSRDHLDYHGSMEAYFAAKKLLFDQCDAMLVNIDDEHGARLLREAGCPDKYSYSEKDGDATFLAHGVRLGPGGVRFVLQSRLPEREGTFGPLDFAMPGDFSVYNALAAAGSALLLGCGAGATMAALQGGIGVPGRSEVLYNGGFTVLCDFAHTSDAVEKLLATLRPFVKGRLVVLYGCAGERDPAKRPEMSESALRYGDVVCLTADNPRGEPLEDIFADALPPLEKGGKPYTVEPDREKAVRAMLDTLQTDDMLVLCGKGHEDYQAMNGYTLYLSEKDIVREWLREKGLR